MPAPKRPNRFQIQKQRLRENKKRQIEAIEDNAMKSKERVRKQYQTRVESINRQEQASRSRRKTINAI